MCSGTHTEWNPTASAAWAKSRAYVAPNFADPSNACTNPISQPAIGGHGTALSRIVRSLEDSLGSHRRIVRSLEDSLGSHRRIVRSLGSHNHRRSAVTSYCLTAGIDPCTTLGTDYTTSAGRADTASLPPPTMRREPDTHALAAGAPTPRPAGTVTPSRRATMSLLFTDIVGSTRQWEQCAGMSELVEAHFAVLRDAVAASGGEIFATMGDGIAAGFTSVDAAVRAAVAAQLQMPAVGLAVRMGVHTGEVERVGDDFRGRALNRAARIMSSGHGGQILLSDVSAALVRNGPEPLGLVDRRPPPPPRPRRARAAVAARAPGSPGDVPAGAGRRADHDEPAGATLPARRSRRRHPAASSRRSTASRS